MHNALASIGEMQWYAKRKWGDEKNEGLVPYLCIWRMEAPRRGDKEE